MTGAILDHVCCRHLYGIDRLLTVWRAQDHAVVLLIGPHSGNPADVYAQVLAAVDQEIPAEQRTKPPCCGEGESPPIDEATVDQLVGAVATLARPRRRRRPSP